MEDYLISPKETTGDIPVSRTIIQWNDIERGGWENLNIGFIFK